ncbi:hypothetical protein I7I53_07898 [Histoplasma capsulatum var. duboisii H88]|uniref:Uncharacterized protein n=1 Tax=Ajellomyces capsulatus (strain H88) TaxID=544711 RepID=A0A8A1LI19_AJEC8|nr:hypothetical protein I7I53_07898 [Histoplasma capsulatum var. duboisii H88]
MYFPPLIPSDNVFLNISEVLCCLFLIGLSAFFLFCRSIALMLRGRKRNDSYCRNSLCGAGGQLRLRNRRRQKTSQFLLAV